jgi:predicted ATPase/class 3 adenylate cyclase
MSELPAGVVTFMLTDVEDSTRKWETNPEAMRQAMLDHDRILAVEIARRDGAVVESGREGDSVLAAFRTAGNAVRCALAVQRTFAVQPWPRGAHLNIRIAINTGEAELRGGHYYGQPLYRCARLMAIGYGGQVLLTKATADLARRRLPARSQLVDLGWHRLRDLDKREHVHQLSHPDLEHEFPPLKSEAVRRHNLPVQVTSFVDREVDVDQVKKLIRQHRLVTLVGPSGVGKTRMGLRVADEISSRTPATLAELASLADPALVTSTVANAVGLRDESRVIDAHAIADWLAGGRVLLVLDSCEHLIDSVAGLCQELLAASPNLNILATSGEALGVPGEATWQVAPLPTGAESVRLFNDRAHVRRPTSIQRDDDIVAVREICERLDGLPLAIELAAARTAVMSPREIVGRLGDRFALLGSGRRSRDLRHRTLRSAIDWSHDLLTPRERVVFARLAVFVGGFSLQAAEAVCSGEGVAQSEVADTVWRLVDKSLVSVREGPEGSTRHVLLETLREYGLERLASLDEEATRKRHAIYFVALAQGAGPLLRGPDGPSWLQQLDADNDNFRAALAGGGLDGEGRLQLAVALIEYWDKQTRYTEARQCLAEALGAAREPSSLRATALRGLALMAWTQADLDEADARCHESLEMCQLLGDRSGVGWSLEQLAQVSYQREEFEAARKFAADALSIALELQEGKLHAMCLFRLGVIDMFEGAEADAKRNLEAASALADQFGDAEVVAISMAVLGYIAAGRGDIAIARTRLARALSRWREHLVPPQVALILDGFALAAAAGGEDERAMRLAGAARALRRRIGSPPGSRLHRMLRQRLGPARRVARGRSLLEQGARMSLPAAVAYALGEEGPA